LYVTEGFSKHYDNIIPFEYGDNYKVNNTTNRKAHRGSKQFSSDAKLWTIGKPVGQSFL